jgi:hypothetical protein
MHQHLEITAPASIARIRELNDNFRRTFVGGVVVITPGIEALCREVKAEVLRRVRTFDHFNKDNDPHGEHDFLSFTIAGQTFFAKIDYYDRAMENGSDNPADTSKTTRVLTVMLSEEY